MFPVHKAPGTIIKGRIDEASLRVYRLGMSYQITVIDPKDYPAQKNNLNAWLKEIMKVVSADLRKDLIAYLPDIRYEVNDGEGQKKGKGSNVNKLTYRLETPTSLWKIDLIITCKLYQQLYYEKVRAGLHTPRAKPPNPYASGRRLPWYSPQRRKYVTPLFHIKTGVITGYLDYDDLNQCVEEFKQDNEDSFDLTPDDIPKLDGAPVRDYDGQSGLWKD